MFQERFREIDMKIQLLHDTFGCDSANHSEYKQRARNESRHRTWLTRYIAMIKLE